MENRRVQISTGSNKFHLRLAPSFTVTTAKISRAMKALRAEIEQIDSDSDLSGSEGVGDHEMCLWPQYRIAG